MGIIQTSSVVDYVITTLTCFFRGFGGGLFMKKNIFVLLFFSIAISAFSMPYWNPFMMSTWHLNFDGQDYIVFFNEDGTVVEENSGEEWCWEWQTITDDGTNHLTIIRLDYDSVMAGKTKIEDAFIFRYVEFGPYEDTVTEYDEKWNIHLEGRTAPR
jgi:hypothetical protein